MPVVMRMLQLSSKRPLTVSRPYRCTHSVVVIHGFNESVAHSLEHLNAFVRLIQDERCLGLKNIVESGRHVWASGGTGRTLLRCGDLNSFLRPNT